MLRSRRSLGPSCRSLGPSSRHQVGLGEPVAVSSLPPPETRRWSPRRKAQLVCAVQAGLLSVEDVCARYSITLEEWSNWETQFARDGRRGLRVLGISQYRAERSLVPLS